MKKYFITGNKNKFKEIFLYIKDLEQLKVKEIPEIQSLDIKEIIQHKLLEAQKQFHKSNSIILVEDTGLYLKAMNDFPGPLIKFLLSSIGNEGIYNVCNSLNNYEAFATTVFGMLNVTTNKINYFSATINGIISEPKGEFGFGWDQIFTPEGADKTFAEMETVEEKNMYSMRFIAIKKLLSSSAQFSNF